MTAPVEGDQVGEGGGSAVGVGDPVVEIAPIRGLAAGDPGAGRVGGFDGGGQVRGRPVGQPAVVEEASGAVVADEQSEGGVAEHVADGVGGDGSDAGYLSWGVAGAEQAGEGDRDVHLDGCRPCDRCRHPPVGVFPVREASAQLSRVATRSWPRLSASPSALAAAAAAVASSAVSTVVASVSDR